MVQGQLGGLIPGQLIGLLARRMAEVPRLPFIPGKTPVPVSGPTYDHAELENAICAVLEFQPAAGRWARQLEQRLGAYFERKCLLTNSGSSANLLALAALHDASKDPPWAPGDEVIVPACSFPTTVSPIVRLGLVPVFVDAEPPNYNVKRGAIEEARSDRTVAVMAAHTLGMPCEEMAPGGWHQDTSKRCLPLIEDNCDSFGATIGGRLTGTFGALSTLSFYPAHHMTTGEGGAVLCDAGIFDLLGSLRDWGRDCWCAPGKSDTCGERFSQQHGDLPLGYDHKYTYSHLGFNFKTTDMQAAIGCAQIGKIEKFVKRRRDTWAFYRRELADLEDRLEFQVPPTGSEPSPFGFLMTVRGGGSRAKIVRTLEAAKIQTRPLFAGNMVRQPAMKGAKYRIAGNGALPGADRALNSAFWIGVHPGVTDEMRGYVVEVMRKAVREI